MGVTSHVVEDGHEEDVVVAGREEGGFELSEHEGGVLEAGTQISVVERLSHEVRLLLRRLLSVLQEFLLLIDHPTKSK